MSRRRFLKASALIGASAAAGLATAGQQPAPARATRKPIRILMGGYGPPTTGFSLAMKLVGDRLETKFGKDVEVKYVYNIIDLGYKAEDILWLVEEGVLTLGYQSSSYLTDRVPELGIADLPFLFSDGVKARAAMDGRFGQLLAARTEAKMNYRILGWFENGFRHISNRLRPIHVPADMKGMTIRVLPSKVQERTFQLLGASPNIMDLSEVVPAVKAGTIDAQENPFANTVTYGIHKYHHFHSATNHFYLSRPIFLHRPSFDAWPRPLQEAFHAAVAEAVAFQRGLHVKEEEDAIVAIRAEGGNIVELTPHEHAAFVEAVTPIYAETRGQYDPELRSLVNL
jgi:tripartite ATP-independent transporter DctP family solute receptor